MFSHLYSALNMFVSAAVYRGVVCFNTLFQLVRINLSEQTDVSDLFGSDLPMPDTPDASSRGVPTSDGPRTDVGDGSNARFAWCDGVFLRALKAGKWVLLDELNLATQVSPLGRV